MFHLRQLSGRIHKCTLAVRRPKVTGQSFTRPLSSSSGENEQNTNPVVRSPETDFLTVIKDYIYMRGPISVAEYMRIALLHPSLGIIAALTLWYSR